VDSIGLFEEYKITSEYEIFSPSKLCLKWNNKKKTDFFVSSNMGKNAKVFREVPNNLHRQNMV
jgi:hypothetical protein